MIPHAYSLMMLGLSLNLASFLGLEFASRSHNPLITLGVLAVFAVGLALQLAAVRVAGRR